MAIERSFTAPLPPPDVWAWISDLERLAGALPGLSQVARDDAGVTGKLILRIGSNQVTYTGRIAVAASDGRAHRLDLAATGSGARGSGEVSAQVRIAVATSADGSTVTVTVWPAGSGRIETFDPEAVRAGGERLLDRFVAAVQEALPESVAESESAAERESVAAHEPVAEHEPEPVQPVPEPVAEPASAPEPSVAPIRRERFEQTEHLATVTSISDVVRSRSRARRGAAASALAMVAAVVALWLVRRRNAR